MKQKGKNIKNLLFGVLIGLANGLFGAGGGMIAVPVLKSNGQDQKTAHKNAVAVILPLAAVSAIMYYFSANISFRDASVYMLPGVVGAAAATFVMQKISPVFLRAVYGGFMIWAGVRLWLK